MGRRAERQGDKGEEHFPVVQPGRGIVVAPVLGATQVDDLGGVGDQICDELAGNVVSRGGRIGSSGGGGIIRDGLRGTRDE